MRTSGLCAGGLLLSVMTACTGNTPADHDWAVQDAGHYQVFVSGSRTESQLGSDGRVLLKGDYSSGATVQAVKGRYQLRGLVQSGGTLLTPETTARFALADTDGDDVLSEAEVRGYQYPDSQDLAEVRNILQTVFIHAGDADAGLLDRYPDSWQLARAVAQDPVHRTAFQVKHHDLLARTEAGLGNLSIPQAKPDEPLNPEMQYMLRLDDNGKPLRWQFQPYENTPWTCADYFEKGVRWMSEMSGRWELGVRIWQVSDNGETAKADAPEIIKQLNSGEYCGYSDWRLPSKLELLTLTDPASGEWDFPLTLPFNHNGYFWAMDADGNTVAFNPSTRATSTRTEAQLLPISFTADAPPPVKKRATTDVDLAELRAVYSRPPEEWPAPQVDAGVKWRELGPLDPMPFPADNPYSEEKVTLGQALFFDTGLSAERNIACASCHIVDQMWSDQRRVSVGTHDTDGKRNAMPVTNTGYNTSLFWDGRVVTLEEQSVHPVMDRLEMALTLDELVQRIKENPVYPDLFKAAFGDDDITLERYKKAVATFERTLISQPAALDRFLAGDKQAMTDKQIWGMHLYRTKARCMNCHSGPALTDYSFRNTGLTYYGRKLEDEARFNQTYHPGDMGAFRVPSLRDITYSAPYMHNGVFPVLAREGANGNVGGVIPMYNAGMTKGRNANYPQYRHKYDPFFPVVDDLIQPLGMSNQEILAVAAFLEAVSAEPRTAPADISILKNPSSEIK
ncbi:MAG: hypothetical protein CMH98_18735 [Oceanospirillaceae bacterium]|nr:hypothetical protein [Oceanospirillaceae bacterium]